RSRRGARWRQRSGRKSVHGHPSGVHARRGRSRSLPEPRFRAVVLPWVLASNPTTSSVVGFFRAFRSFRAACSRRHPPASDHPLAPRPPMIIRRRSLFLFLTLTLVLLSMDVALAQTSSTTSSSTFNISWSALDPGDDWTWAMLQSVFPVSGTPPTNTGAAATLIGTLLGQIT